MDSVIAVADFSLQTGIAAQTAGHPQAIADGAFHSNSLLHMQNTSIIILLMFLSLLFILWEHQL
jgi:hypothetical protein